MAQTLYLIDGMAIAYRSYYAFIQRPLINSRGENTSAIYGFVTFLNKILEDERPDFVAVVFDTAAPTFRHRTYAEYKATREKMPEDMASQLEMLKDVVRAYNVPVLELEGYEADDIIGTLAKRAEQEKVDSYLVTGDKDFMQLVSKRVKIYRPGRKGTDVEIVETDGVLEKFGVPPDQVVDVLGLMGDSSDNIPGVPGIGEKTAIPLIQEYRSIENLFKKIDQVSRKGVREKLITHKDLALLSKKLVTIDTNVPLDVDFHSLKSSGKNIPQLRDLFERLEFKGLLRNLQQPLIDTATVEPVASPERNDTPAAQSPILSLEPVNDMRTDEHVYTLVVDEAALLRLCKRLKSVKELAVDTETTSTDSLKAELVGISISPEEREAYFIPVKTDAPRSESPNTLFDDSPTISADTPESPSPLPLAFVIEQLKPILEDASIKKIGQNLKYDYQILFRHGVTLRGISFDTMIASYLLRADDRHNLDALALEHLNYRTITFSDLVGTKQQQVDIRDVPIQSLSDYACEDADVTLRLSLVLREQLEQSGMSGLFEDIELPLLTVLAHMELDGVTIDTNQLSEMSKEIDRLLGTLTSDIVKHAGGDFNINSTQQLSEILFDRLGLAPLRKTKTGFSTDFSVLQQLEHQHPIIPCILEYRQLTKLKSTYVDALPQLINPQTGRVHTTYNQTVAATGRLSSSDPNLQNIPIRTELGRSIRGAFVPGGPERVILSADYSQIELRIMAHISEDKGLQEAFLRGEDVHATTAAKVFGVASSEVSREMRRRAKEVNFGIMYGIGPFGLARRLDINQGEAKEIIDRYFTRFPNVRAYIDRTIGHAREKGYVETLSGRRRYLSDINSRNNNIRQNAERQAINMPIQGTAADMIKSAMVRIARELERRTLQSKMILQVHDELVFEVWKGEVDDMTSIVRSNMEEALPLSVPLHVDIGIGSSWLAAH